MSTPISVHYDRCTTMVAYDGGVPPPNQHRRNQLADAAIALLAESGVHGVTHRTVERHAGLPAGTASNYFRSRESLLVACAERIGELHQADMDDIARTEDPTSSGTRERASQLIAQSLLRAAGEHRERYLAIFELRMEALRRPAVAHALDELFRRSQAFTAGHHAALHLDIPPESLPVLLTLYGGALFTLVTGPPEAVDPKLVRDLAAGIVRAAVPGGK
jgi:AcrR family transcriptional regulator